MTIGIKILESTSTIQKRVLLAMIEELNPVFLRATNSINLAIRSNSPDFFKNTKEYNALINGPLDGHFGLPEGSAQKRCDSIINTIINNIECTFTGLRIQGDKIAGGIEVGVLIADFSDVLANPDATVITYDGQKLPWLDWLLIQGDKIIVQEYIIKFGNFLISRSGKALMRPKKGGMWRVPPEYSGTVENNWLTRSIFGLSDAYTNMILQVMQEKIEAEF